MTLQSLCAILSNPDSRTLAALGCHKFVFITSDIYNSDLGGLTGADQKCQSEAATIWGLPGKYKAWLSDDTNSPSTRFTKATVAYVRPGAAATLIASDWTDLTTNGLRSSITFGDGETAASGPVWTATAANGTRASGSGSCLNWGPPPANGNAGNTYIGDAQRTDPRWTFSRVVSCLDIGGRGQPLYCFQQ